MTTAPAERASRGATASAPRPVPGSAIYEGWVTHRRLAPVEHSLRYRVFMPLVDVDRLPEILDPYPLWSASRRAPARFRRSDYLRGHGDDRPLGDAARDLVAARTGLRDHEARPAGFDPVTVGSEADDHKAYYPGSHRITIRVTGDRATGQLLGMQLFGHKNAEIAKRVDIAATTIYHGMTVDAVSDLDLSYTPPLGSPWDAVQIAAQAWVRQTRPR